MPKSCRTTAKADKEPANTGTTNTFSLRKDSEAESGKRTERSFEAKGASALNQTCYGDDTPFLQTSFKKLHNNPCMFFAGE